MIDFIDPKTFLFVMGCVWFALAGGFILLIHTWLKP